MDKIKYSIVIPHKNSPQLLKRCLNSIPQRKDIQIVVVDDDSDASIVEFDNFPGINDERVVLVFLKESRGAGYARNIGLTKVIGTWVLFSDADDYYKPEAFDVIDTNLEPELEILYFDICSDNESGTSRTQMFNRFFELYRTKKDDSFVRYGLTAPWYKVISLSFIQKYDIKFDEIPVCNDAMFALKTSSLASRYKILNDRLYVLVDNTDSITFKRRTFERQMHYLEARIRINNYLYSVDKKIFYLNVLNLKVLLREFINGKFSNISQYILFIHRHYGLLKSLNVLMICCYRHMIMLRK